MSSLPETAKNVSRYFWEVHRPTTTMPHNGLAPISFTVEGRDDQFIDVKNIQQIVKCRVRKINAAGARENLAQADACVPYNGLLWTMWHDVEVQLQHRLLYRSYGYYDLATYLQVLTSVPKSAKAHQLSNALWFRDKAGAHSVIQQNLALNAAEYKRGLKVARSATFEMQGRLMVDCFQTARPLPNGVTITLQFYPNESKRCLVAEQDDARFVLEILDMYLLVPRIVPKPSLLNKPAVLPYSYTQCFRMNIPFPTTNFGPRNVVVTDSLPRRCMVVLLTEKQLNGAFTTNRLEFNHQNVDQILLQVNGVHLPVSEGFKPNWQTQEYGNLYQALFEEIGSPDTIDILREEYSGGFAIFVFNIDQKNILGDKYPGKQAGSIDLTLHFSQPTTSNLAALVFLEGERVCKINKNRDFVDELALK